MSITKKSSVLFDPISFNFNPFLFLQIQLPVIIGLTVQIEPEQASQSYILPKTTTCDDKIHFKYVT